MLSVNDSKKNYPLSFFPPKSRYGPIDQRQNIYQINQDTSNPEFSRTVIRQSQSVACLIQDKFLKKGEDGLFYLESFTPSLAEARETHNAPFGEYENFRKEPVPGEGTAFLVTNQLAFTARHCICIGETDTIDQERVKTMRLVFGFQKTSSHQQKYAFEERDIYRIVKIAVYSDINEDWALVKLDRKVEKRPYLHINFTSRMAKKTKIYMLGHPSGLPLKYTGEAEIQDIHRTHIEADLDAFGGNSGSPVIRSDTQEVIGLLTQGNQDYEITEDYYGTGKRRVQVYQSTSFETFTRGYERVQRLDHLTFAMQYILAHLGNLDAQFALGQTLCLGLHGVKRDKRAGIKWLKKAAEPKINLTEISYLGLIEYIATETLKLGPRALEKQREESFGTLIGGTLITLISLPLFGIPGIVITHNGVKSDKSKRFELLALDDPRFQVFQNLAEGDLVTASRTFDQHETFLRTVMRTECFLREFTICLLNCDNSYEWGKDIEKRNMYINFLLQRKAIPMSYKRYLIPRKPDSSGKKNVEN